MNGSTERFLNTILRRRQRHRRFMAMLLVFALFVTSGTAWVLRSPAKALTRTERVLDCPFSVKKGDGYAGFAVHEHNEDCYDTNGNLVCKLPEVRFHEHDESCYDENGELTCDKRETILHKHSDSCYDGDGKLICGKLELEEHIHGPGCFREITIEEPDPESPVPAEPEPTAEPVPETVEEPAWEPEIYDELIWEQETEEEPGFNQREDDSTGTAEQPAPQQNPNSFGSEEPDQIETAVPVSTDQNEPAYPVADQEETQQESGPVIPTESQFFFLFEEEEEETQETPDEETEPWEDEEPAEGQFFFLFDEEEETQESEDTEVPAENSDEAAENEEALTEEENTAAKDAVSDEEAPEETEAGEREETEQPEETEETEKSEESEEPEETEAASEEEETVPAETEETEEIAKEEGPDKEEKTEEPAEPEEVPMPAASFEETTDALTVRVEAPEGAFPEGTTMAVTPVEDEEILNAVAEPVEGQVLQIFAVDISFFNADGEEIEPLLPIRVEMIPLSAPDEEPETEASPVSAEQAENQIQTVVHLDGEGNASVMEQAEDEISGEGAVGFEADSFSVYALIYSVIEKTVLASDGETYRITLNYSPEAGIPYNAELEVTEILPGTEAYMAYAQMADDSLADEMVSFARFFDITIVANGAEIQPAAPVEVRIELADDLDESVKALHFGEEVEVLDAASAEAETPTETAGNTDTDETGTLNSGISFSAEGFSVYGVVLTTLEKTISASDGNTYDISVNYRADAKLPLGAELSVEEIFPSENLEDGETDAYQEYALMIRDALGWENGSASYLRLFEIKILDENGEKTDIAAPVEVKIELADKEDDEDAAPDTQVLHIADGAAAADVISGVEVNGGTVSFAASGFSAYAIVEGPEALPIGWHKVLSLEDLISRGDQGLYIGHPDGYYYMNTTTEDASRTGISKTKPANSYPGENAALYYFEPVENSENQVYAYCFAEDGVTRQYVYNGGNNSLSFTEEESKTAFTVTQNSNGTFKLNNGAWFWNMQGGASGSRFCSYNSANDGNNNVNLWYYVDVDSDPYELDGQSYGLMNWSGGVAGKAMMASSATANTLEAKSLTVMSTADNASQLFVPNSSEISLWTFHWVSEDRYHMTTVADGSTKYLRLEESGLSLVSAEEDASEIQVVPGTGIHAGEICLQSEGSTLTYMGTVDSGFSVGGSVGSEWLNLVEVSNLTKDYFLTYSARKVSVSDQDISNGSRVIVYTRSWNEAKLKYDYFAISSDGTLVPVYESGDSIEWVSGQLNTLLWNFVEYYWEGTTDPNYYYELYNQYSEKYIAPQITDGQILSDETIGINLNGRRDGQYYSPILAWDEENYSYVGLKVENGRIVICPMAEAMDFYFALMQDLNVDDTLTKVNTVDHTQYGITMKLKDFTTREQMSSFLGNDEGGATLNLQQGLLSSSLTNGYPLAAGGSLGDLYAGAQEVNHLFIQSTYGETGYFEFDSAQNYATLKDDAQDADGIPDFVVYKELGSYDSGGNKNTLKHGQFFPYNDLKPGTFASTNGKNLYSSTGAPLPDSDPRKYEQLYSVEYDGKKANCYFGVELEASFTQTPSGLDAWGHDIIFEFTGDDDFWLYVDGELVIDLGGIHSAVPGSVNFRTGTVNVNGISTTLRTLFESNFRGRNPGASDADVEAYLSSYFGEGSTVFKDGTTHTMNIFYMERGAGASNLHMRFNLAAVKKGTVQLSKTLSGVDESNVLAEFPYQILYKKDGETEYRLTNALPAPTQNVDYVFYKDTLNPVKYQQTLEIDGIEYQDVFFLKPGETADINFPEGMTSYRIVECAVNTEVYSGVRVNGTEISGTEPVGNGVSGANEPELEGAAASARKDYGIDYATTDARPKVAYENIVNPDALRTLTVIKRLYAEDGETEITNNNTEFTLRLYLATEFGELDTANMHVYHVKDSDGVYCSWDTAGKQFVPIKDEDDHGIKNYADLTDEQKEAAVFTTSIYGSIGRIRTGYTVEIRDVLAGTRYRLEERPSEIPDGFSFQKYDDYDTLNASVVERGNSGVMGVNGTVVSGRDASVTVCNLKGWGLRVNKVWRDADYMSDRKAAYFALFTETDGDLTLVPGSVREMLYSVNPQSIYWYYEKLPVPDTTGVEDYLIREITISTDDPNTPGTVTPIGEGGTIALSGTQKGESGFSNFVYTVRYVTGAISQESNVRVDTVTNDRPGIVLKKQDWDGNDLAGATFTLAVENGNILGTYTSNDSGLITTAYLSNHVNYILTETSTPQGYHGLETELLIRDDDGTVSVIGPGAEYYTLTQAEGTNPATLVLKNHPYTFQAVKKDGTAQTPLSGVTFALHREVTVDDVTTIDLNAMPGYEELATDDNGVIPKLDNTLPAGTYELRELEAPDGYEPLTGHIRFTVSGTGAITLGEHPDGVTLTETTNDAGAIEYTLTVLNDSVIKTQKLSFKKVDLIRSDTTGLTGAEFDLYRVTNDVRDDDPLYAGLVSGSDGILSYMPAPSQTEQDESAESTAQEQLITVFELEEGTYDLVETRAPNGYIIKMEPVRITISSTEVTNSESDVMLEGRSAVIVEDGVIMLLVTNISGNEMPETGGSGVEAFYLAGTMLMLTAGAALVLHRKKEETD